MLKHAFLRQVAVLCMLVGSLSLIVAQAIRLSQARYYALVQDGKAHQLLADWWQDAGDDGRAFAYWQRAYSAAPTSDLAVRIGSSLLKQGEWQALLDLAQDVLQREPNNAWAHAQCGFILAATHPNAALQHLQPILLDRTYGIIASNLYSALKDSKSSVPKAFYVGSLLAQAGFIAHAEAAFSYAAAQNYPFPEAMANAAYMRALQGKSGELLLHEARLFAPQEPNIMVLNALYHRALGEIDQSLSLLAAAYRLNPNDAAVATELGITHGLVGDVDAAQDWLTHALNLNPEYDTARFYLAQVLIAQGNFQAAQPHLERLARRETRYAEEARKLLDQLAP